MWILTLFIIVHGRSKGLNFEVQTLPLRCFWDDFCLTLTNVIRSEFCPRTALDFLVSLKCMGFQTVSNRFRRSLKLTARLFKQAHVSAGIDFKKYDDIEVLQLGSTESLFFSLFLPLATKPTNNWHKNERTKRQPKNQAMAMASKNKQSKPQTNNKKNIKHMLSICRNQGKRKKTPKWIQTTHRLRTDNAQTTHRQYRHNTRTDAACAACAACGSVCSVCSVWRTEVRQHKICTLHVAKTESREPHSHSANTKKETK